MFTAIALVCTLDGSLCRAVVNPVVFNDLTYCNEVLGEGVKRIEEQVGLRVASYRCIPWGELT